MKTDNMIKVSLLGALAFILSYFPKVPFFFIPFIDFDFSDLPALVAAIALGPFFGVAVELLKNVLHLFSSSTGGVGEIANFAVGSCIVLPVGLLMSKNKTNGNLLIGLIIGVVVATLSASLLNYFILIPLWAGIFGTNFDGIVSATAGSNALVTSKLSLILFGVVPANLIKFSIVSVAALLLFKYLSEPLLRVVKKIH
ncbi:MAG: ECF transporter S component [Lachnospirales bacterium]